MPGRLVETMNHEQFVDFINSAYMNSKGITIYNDENPAPNIHTDWQRKPSRVVVLCKTIVFL